MKVFIFSSALLALAVADTCSDCTAVVSTIAARLSSEESLAAQGAILVGELCPSQEDPAGCEAALPEFWNMIAALLWPGYWDPNGEWMCAPICEAPEDVDMTCDDCKMGIQAAIVQLLLMVFSEQDFLCLQRWLMMQDLNRLAMLLWRTLALPGSSGSSE